MQGLRTPYATDLLCTLAGSTLPFHSVGSSRRIRDETSWQSPVPAKSRPDEQSLFPGVLERAALNTMLSCTMQRPSDDPKHHAQGSRLSRREVQAPW